MAMNYNNKRPGSTETIHMGSFLHACEELAVLKLEHRNIPYPNSPVLARGKVVGKIDEVFGPMNNTYVSVRFEGGAKVADYKAEDKFESYKDKFIFRDRFLPREEVERQKERNDKNRKAAQKGGFKGKGGFGDRRKPGGQNFRNNRGGNDGHRGNQGGSDRGRFNNNRGGFNNNGPRKDFRKRSE